MIQVKWRVGIRYYSKENLIWRSERDKSQIIERKKYIVQILNEINEE